jgi:hypothetical protein
VRILTLGTLPTAPPHCPLPLVQRTSVRAVFCNVVLVQTRRTMSSPTEPSSHTS